MPLLEGVRVVALDFRGHGLSQHGDSYGYADYQRDVTWLLDRLKLDDVTVAGHSLGGYVALLAARRSDRIGRVLAIDVKSDWTEEDAAFAERSRDATQRVEHVRCRAEVLAGSESEVMPLDSARRFAEALPGATVEVIDGAGHHVELDAPELVAERILG